MVGGEMRGECGPDEWMREERMRRKKGVRPSSFIAPLERNVELSNGAAMVITIKTTSTGEKRQKEKRKRLGHRGKHKV